MSSGAHGRQRLALQTRARSTGAARGNGARLHGLVMAALIGCVACQGLDTPAAPSDSRPPAAPGRYEVSITGANVVLGGYLFRPDTAEPRAAVIVLHGWQTTGTNGAAVVEARARRYAEDGYVALALSMRGWPPSGGADDCGLRQPDDVAAAITWLRAQPGVIADRVGIVGFSQGGQVALLTATRDARLAAIVAYYPVTDVATWKTTTTNPDIPGYVTAVCEPGGADLRSPVRRAAEIGVPVLLVHGDRDTRVPTDQSRALSAALSAAGRAPELLLVPGAQHGFTAAEEAVARPVVDSFLSTRLR